MMDGGWVGKATPRPPCSREGWVDRRFGAHGWVKARISFPQPGFVQPIVGRRYAYYAVSAPIGLKQE